ncbi:MAG: TPM domain-containing protein [Novosphingobium sp.]
MRRLIACLLALLAVVSASPAWAAFPPRPEGPVLDAAGILPPAEEAALDARLRAYTTGTGRALVVATVPSLDGQTIEMYAVELFEQWGIGGKESDAGLLLLVAPNEHKVRIEVGYGLHQYVTDALSGRIIRDTITPRFRTGDYAGGIVAGVDALVAQLDRDPADVKAVAEAAAAAAAQQRDEGGASFGGIVFWIVLLIVFMAMFGGRRRGRGYRGSGIGGNLPIILWGASEMARHMGGSRGGFGGGGFGGGGGGFGGFGGGMSGGGGASGSW